jgi:hypothetical protein
MKLWSAMQRIESLRYQAERLEAHAEWGTPRYRQLMADIERQLDELAAQAQALLDERAPLVDADRREDADLRAA